MCVGVRVTGDDEEAAADSQDATHLVRKVRDGGLRLDVAVQIVEETFVHDKVEGAVLERQRARVGHRPPQHWVPPWCTKKADVRFPLF